MNWISLSDGNSTLPVINIIISIAAETEARNKSIETMSGCTDTVTDCNKQTIKLSLLIILSIYFK